MNIAPTNFINSVPYSFFLKPITEVGVIGQLRNLQVSKSTGTNGIPHHIYQNVHLSYCTHSHEIVQ